MSINNVEIINNFVLTNVCNRHIIVVEQQNHTTRKKGGRNVRLKDYIISTLVSCATAVVVTILLRLAAEWLLH